MSGHFADDVVERAHELMSLYPHKRSALIPICHLAQEQDGWLTPEAIDEIAELARDYPRRGLRHGFVLRHASHRTSGQLPGVDLHEHRVHVPRRVRAAGACRGASRDADRIDFR